jgi:hypothetical protein
VVVVVVLVGVRSPDETRPATRPTSHKVECARTRELPPGTSSVQPSHPPQVTQTSDVLSLLHYVTYVSTYPAG